MQNQDIGLIRGYHVQIPHNEKAKRVNIGLISDSFSKNEDLGLDLGLK
jgi:hypothetical protein